MPAQRQQSDSDDGLGAPEWMVTFSDCMTLLLTFFVLLISFSSFDEKVFTRMESALAEGLTSVGMQSLSDDRAFRAKPQIVYRREPDVGSEQPTVDGEYQSNPSQSLNFMDFENQKVFVVPSNKVFWGRGALMSTHGRLLLADIAALLKATPNRVIVSEYTLEGDEALDAGLRRAWCITDFLVEEQGIDRMRFSISSASTVGKETLQHSVLFRRGTTAERALEIAILERSIYD